MESADIFKRTRLILQLMRESDVRFTDRWLCIKATNFETMFGFKSLGILSFFAKNSLLLLFFLEKFVGNVPCCSKTVEAAHLFATTEKAS